MISSALLSMALSYWAPNHSAINRQVIEDGEPFDFKRGNDTILTVHDYLQRVLYINDGLDRPIKGVAFKGGGTQLALSSYVPPGEDTPYSKADATDNIRGWNTWGGTWEDGFSDGSEATKWGGLRAVNHFHNPRAPEGGYTGIRAASGISLPPLQNKTGRPTIDLLRKGMSATTWVMGGSAKEKNNWGYPAVVLSMRRFFTDPLAKEREVGLAGAMRAIGQVEHLIEDNSVPDHARDLAHPGDGFEEYMKGSRPYLFDGTPKPWPKMPIQKIEESGIRGFWDRDLYLDFNPAVTQTGATGIDEYTQVNFLAWNRFYLPWFTPQAGLISIDFTTIPKELNTGYEGLPYPLLGSVSDEGWYQNGAGTLPILPCIAKQGAALRGNFIDGNCWGGYAKPLMQKAHGYAQSVFTLVLPAIRAELRPADPLDLRKWRLRVWNLGTGDDAVTWHVDTVKLMPIRPDGLPFPRSATPISLMGVSGDIAPSSGPSGSFWESPVFELTPLDQGDLNGTSHTIVLLEGNIGTMNKTPFVFGAPIPGGLPIVKQATSVMTVDATSQATVNRTDCCAPMQCTPCGESTVLTQPFVQKVTGKLAFYPSQVDLLGEPADGLAKLAMAKDAHIAGVALVAYNSVMQRYFEPTRPTTHTLTVSGMTCAGSVCRRDPDAPDVPDVEQTFSFDFDRREFLSGSAGPQFATASVMLLVWTTSGSVSQHSMLLWPTYEEYTAPNLLARNNGCGFGSRGMPGSENSGGCVSSARMPNCTGTYDSWRRTTLMGPIVGLGAAFQDSDYFFFPTSPKILELGGLASPTSMAGECKVQTPSAGSYSYDITCFSDRNSIIYRQMATTNPNACPPIPAMPTIPHTAIYQGGVPDASKPYLKKLFGRDDFPTWTTTLQ